MNKTQIFGSYSEFLQRADKDINGVSQDFADNNPGYKKDNESNTGCWNCSGCSDCFRCSDCSGCSDCFRCSGCSGCYDCSDCFRCSGCYDCSGWLNNKPPADISNPPVIENIHQKILEAITTNGNKLEMGDWHTCETTHCRAGWVVHLAGADGYAYEKATSTQFAAMRIYKASSPIKVSPPRFFESNDVAMADIIRCAEEEKKLQPQ